MPCRGEQFGYPLSLWTYDEDSARQAQFGPLRRLQPGQGRTYASHSHFRVRRDDLAVRKTFGFDHTYIVNVETSVTYKGSSAPALPAWPSGFGDQITAPFYAAGLHRLPVQQEHRALTGQERSVEEQRLPGPFHWAGPTDQYFAAVFIPDDPASAAMVTLHNTHLHSRAIRARPNRKK